MKCHSEARSAEESLLWEEEMLRFAQHDIVEMSFSELRYEESSERNVEEKHEKDHE